MSMVCTREVHLVWTGILAEGEGSVTIDILAQTSLDPLIFKLKKLFTLVTKQATLIRRSTVLSLPLQLVFPMFGIRDRIHNTSFSPLLAQ